MAAYTVKIKCDNAAFEDGEGPEVARILRLLADRTCEYGAAWVGPLSDINGNLVGEANYEA